MKTSEPVATWLSEQRLGDVRLVTRTGLEVLAQQAGSLVLLDADLVERRRWPLPDGVVGGVGVDVATGEALVGTHDEVRLLDADGRQRWAHAHAEWEASYYSGTCWLDEGGAWAVVRSDFGGCEVIRLDRDTGALRASILIETDPAGIEAIPHPDGWTGLSIGEGQDRVLAWWVRADGADGVEWFTLTHDGEILVDVHPDGDRILLTPHSSGFGGDDLVVRAWPDLTELRRLPPPAGCLWGMGGAFVDDRVVADAVDEEAEEPDEEEVVLAVDPDGAVARMGRGTAVRPGGGESWLQLALVAGDRSVVSRHR